MSNLFTAEQHVHIQAVVDAQVSSQVGAVCAQVEADIQTLQRHIALLESRIPAVRVTSEPRGLGNRRHPKSKRETLKNSSSKLRLQDLPRDILLLIAEWCHLQSREDKWVGPKSLNPKDAWCAVGGGLGRLSQVNKEIRHLVIPILFRRLKICCDEGNMRVELAWLLSNADILQAVRIFKMKSVGPHLDPHNHRRTRWGACDRSTPMLLADVLKAMPNLYEADLNLRYGHKTIIPAFRNYAQQANLRLPCVKGLQFFSNVDTSADISFMAAMCPSLERASFYIPDSPASTPGLAAFSSLETLQEIELLQFAPDGTCAHGWTEEHIQELIQLFPNVRRLYIPGTLRGVRATSLAAILSQLVNLEYLVIATEAKGRGWRPDISNPLREETHNIARCLFEQCPRLKELCLDRVPYPEVFRAVTNRAGVTRSFELVASHKNCMTTNVFYQNPRYTYSGLPRIMEVSLRSADKTQSYSRDNYLRGD